MTDAEMHALKARAYDLSFVINQITATTNERLRVLTMQLQDLNTQIAAEQAQPRAVIADVAEPE